MGFFRDNQELYNAIRDAETDEDRGVVLLDYLMSNLDSGYEPDTVELPRYEDEIVPRVEEELGADALDIELVRYEDADQFLYDMVTETIYRTPMVDALGGVARAMDSGLTTRMTASAQLGLFKTVVSTLGSKLASRIGGAAGPYGEHLSEGTPETEVLAYNTPGIEKIAEKAGEPYEEVWDYVLTHETIHAFQFALYPGLLEDRRDFVDDQASMLENPSNILGGDSSERSEDTVTGIGETLSDPLSLLDNLGPDLSDMEIPSMTLIEGHAEFYTDRIMEKDIREQASQESGLMGGLLKRVTPLGSKQDQYREGKELFEALHERGGDEYVHYTMEHPPETMEEIRNPEQWADHVERQLS